MTSKITWHYLPNIIDKFIKGHFVNKFDISMALINILNKCQVVSIAFGNFMAKLWWSDTEKKGKQIKYTWGLATCLLLEMFHILSPSLSLTRCPILYLPIQTLCSILSFLNSDKGWNKLILIWCQLGGITRFRLPPLFRIQSHFNAFTDKEKKRDKKCALCVYRKPKYIKMNFSWHFHESIDVFRFYTSDIAIARSISMRLEVIICLHLDSFEKWDKKELEKLFLDLCIWETFFPPQRR